MSEPTCWALCYSGKGCLSGVRTYLMGTLLQCCRLFKRCRNLPAGHCVTVVKAVLAMSESTCCALCYSGKACLSCVRTYLPGRVLQGCRLFKRCQNLPTDTVLQWCRLFKQCLNLPAWHSVTVVKALLAMSESTCLALCYSGAVCLSRVGTYLLGTV